jgi:hypothetical protein
MIANQEQSTVLGNSARTEQQTIWDREPKLAIRDSVMSYTSIVAAERMTHLKIVAVSLICATVVAGIGIAARVTDGTTAGSRTEANMIRAGAIVATNGVTIR